MKQNCIDNCLKKLKGRVLEDGGFTPIDNGSYRVDATAWAIVGLIAAGIDGPVVDKARWRLTYDQSEDGSLCISPRHPAAKWPTALAAIAWHGSEKFREYESKAIKFLLNTYGLSIPNDPDDEVGHDTSLRGWPWIIGTHSWIEPTAYSIQALKLTGKKDDTRTGEGIELILNRQLSDGGWNYGNTYVLGNKLRPMPDMTGIALTALSDMIDRKLVENSISNLKEKFIGLNTPRSTSWAVIGLSSWQERPAKSIELIERCWEYQERYGEYDSILISQMIIAAMLSNGFSDLLKREDSNGEVNGKT